jgi:hypothetical protein
MLEPSRKRSPTAPDFDTRSEPAKSTNDILATLSPDVPLFASCNMVVKNIVNTACDRDDSTFIFVTAIVLDRFPSRINLSIS